MRSEPRFRPRVVIAGGGVAAMEAMLALHALVGRRIRMEMIAPGEQMLLRAASVARPFGLGGPPPASLDDLARQCGARRRRGSVVSVDVERRQVATNRGEFVHYDELIVATGARASEAIRGALTFTGPSDTRALGKLLDACESGEVDSVVFALPTVAAWALPLYELAIMTAVDLRSRGAATRLTLVTPEPSPLWIFGERAGDAITELLQARDIQLVHGRPAEFERGALRLAGGGEIAADACVALPAHRGPAITGLPADTQGFLPVDMHGAVRGVLYVHAAGDATSFPIKQGGLACQQADAVAAAIAADLGAIEPAPPFRPVLRGLLLTGGAPLYLRAELDSEGTVTRREGRRLLGEVSARALWWPPGKVAGRYLAPYLATARPVALAREPLTDLLPSAAGRRPDADEAATLALLLAEQDALAGDHAQALHALDAAAALSGGVLPADAARLREECRAATTAVPT
jgi:sulfide:quinone oxidoreductase